MAKIFRIPTSKETLRWRHNDRAGVSNHQPHGCLLNRLFRRKSKKTSKLRVTGLCAGNSPGTGEFPAQMASYAENVSIWWRHHGRGIIKDLIWLVVSALPVVKHTAVLDQQLRTESWPWSIPYMHTGLVPVPCLNIKTVFPDIVFPF